MKLLFTNAGKIKSGLLSRRNVRSQEVEFSIASIELLLAAFIAHKSTNPNDRFDKDIIDTVVEKYGLKSRSMIFRDITPTRSGYQTVADRVKDARKIAWDLYQAGVYLG